nr:DUF4398 domain-containing protein [uncultured Pseudomonas sp.]
MKRHIQQPQRPWGAWKLAIAAVGSSLLIGCASNPPDEQIAVSQSAVDSAFSSGGPEYASVEMKTAQDKLKQAELAMHDENYQEARRLAEEAEWDARLAERKARAAKAQSTLQEAQSAIQRIQSESLRSSSPTPGAKQ